MQLMLQDNTMSLSPSSPSMALFKTRVVHMLERHHIEGRPAELIAENLKDAFNEIASF
jgi:putative YphP/YqiW family bacilliredoxin